MNLTIKRIAYLYVRGKLSLPFSIDIKQIFPKPLWSIDRTSFTRPPSFYCYTVKELYCIKGKKEDICYIEEILLLEWDNLTPTLKELRVEEYRTRSPMAWVQTLYPLVKDLNLAIRIMKQIDKPFITWEEYQENLLVTKLELQSCNINYEMPV